MNRIYFLFFFCITQLSAYAQSTYWIYFYDKPLTSTFEAQQYFTHHAITRREKKNIGWDVKDIPVCKLYTDSIAGVVDTLRYESRWLNAVSVVANDDQLKILERFSFVRGIEKIDGQFYTTDIPNQKKKPLPELLAQFQLRRLGQPLLQQQNLAGKGVIIAVIDAGFRGVDQSPAFKKLFSEKRILNTFDFITKKENVYLGSEHGTMVLSCIAGKTDSIQTGLAPEAYFLLARTESEWVENIIEEDRWIAALEWADQHGASIINSSLGYTLPRYDQSQLNGQSRISKVANTVSDKGMLLINAAGNEFNGDWKSIIIPSDADHSLTVGATDPEDDLQTGFSSVGPTADGRLKPNVCAPGWVAVYNAQGLSTAEGTSFSSPLVAGYAACVLQLHHDTLHPLALKKIIENCGHLVPYFDYAHGYGVPQASSLFYNARPYPSFTVKNIEGYYMVSVDSSWFSSQDVYPLFYFHVQSRTGILKRYGVIEITSSSPFILKKPDIAINDDLSFPVFNICNIETGDILRFHCSGYTHQINIE